MHERATRDMTVPAYMVETLESNRIDYVVLVPGRLVYPLPASIKRSRSITGIVAAHESACGFIADGHARASRSFGVCPAIAGPGTMNLPAMAAARADKIPVLYVLGGMPSCLEGHGALQDGTHGGIGDAGVVRGLVNTVAGMRSPPTSPVSSSPATVACSCMAPGSGRRRATRPTSFTSCSTIRPMARSMSTPSRAATCRPISPRCRNTTGVRSRAPPACARPASNASKTWRRTSRTPSPARPPYLPEVKTSVVRAPNRYSADSHAAFEAAMKQTAPAPAYAAV